MNRWFKKNSGIYPEHDIDTIKDWRLLFFLFGTDKDGIKWYTPLKDFSVKSVINISYEQV